MSNPEGLESISVTQKLTSTIQRCMCIAAHAAGSGGDGAVARALPALARRHQEAHRGAHREGVPRAHARRPQSLHLRCIGELHALSH